MERDRLRNLLAKTYVCIHYDLYFRRTFRRFVGSGFSDGGWHQLLFVMDNTEALITTDSCEDGGTNCSKSVGFFSVEHQLFSSLISGKLFVGGIQSVDDILNRPDQV